MKVLVGCLFLVAAAQAADWANLRPVTRTKPLLRHTAPASRIRGGSLATVGQIKYQVALVIDGHYFCSGSLIADNVVLTSGTCVEGSRSFEIHAGALNLPNEQEPGRVIVTSSDAIYHENFEGDIDDNIGVIKLSESISGPNIAAVRLPARSQAGDAFIGTTARVSGWGTAYTSSTSLSPDLRFVDVSIISNDECSSYFGTIAIKNLCISTNGGTEGTCKGDSGDPLVITEADGLPSQVGISTFLSNSGCSGSAAGFARVTEYLDWLETNAGVTIRP